MWSTFSSKYSNAWIKFHWKELMMERRICNSLGNTFTISEIIRPGGNVKFEILLEAPAGLIENHLKLEETFIGTFYGGDASIGWNYDKDCIQVAINKKQSTDTEAMDNQSE